MKNLKYVIATLFQVVIICIVLIVARSCNKDHETKEVSVIQNLELNYPNRENDSTFLVRAAEINLMEISLGQLVQQNTLNKDLKSMAKLMEDKYGKLMIELTVLAAKKNIIIPLMPTNDVKDAYKSLNTKAGTDFGKVYCDMMVKEQRNAIILFDKASSESNDLDIKAWAIITLPNFRSNLDYVINCQNVCEYKK